MVKNAQSEFTPLSDLQRRVGHLSQEDSKGVMFSVAGVCLRRINLLLSLHHVLTASSSMHTKVNVISGPRVYSRRCMYDSSNLLGCNSKGDEEQAREEVWKINEVLLNASQRAPGALHIVIICFPVP